MTLTDTLSVVAASFCAAALSETLSWALVYRTESYKKTKREMATVQEALDKAKAAEEKADPNNKKSAQKKVATQEERLKEVQLNLQTTQMKSTVANMVVMVSLFSMMNKWFGGIVVGRIPFTPWGFVQGFSHRGLEGEDFQDCSFLLIYVMSSMWIRPSLQKILGTAGKAAEGTPSFLRPPQ